MYMITVIANKEQIKTTKKIVEEGTDHFAASERLVSEIEGT